MAEEQNQRQPRASSPPPGQPSGGNRPMTRGQRQRHQKSVFQYIAIMFGAAFILLLFSYMMERRQYEQIQAQNQEQIDDLRQTVSSVRSLQGLYDENEALKAQVAELEGELEQASQELEQVPDTISRQERLFEMTCQALDYFWQIDEAYVRGRTALCKELIQALEEKGLAEFLPTDSATGNDRFSPYDRYMEIREKMIR